MRQREHSTNITNNIKSKAVLKWIIIFMAFYGVASIETSNTFGGYVLYGLGFFFIQIIVMTYCLMDDNATEE